MKKRLQSAVRSSQESFADRRFAGWSCKLRTATCLLTFAFATTILGQTDSTPKDKQSPPDVLRKLSKRERLEKIKGLDVRHQDFVGDVEPIIVPAELDTFLMLETDAQRDSFVDDFWRRRDAAGGSPTISFRDVYYSRLEVAKERFRKINTDRAKMFLLHGPPSDVVRADCSRLLQPIEIWKYSQMQGVGQGVRLLFYKPRYANDYKLWNPIGGAVALAELTAADVIAASAADRATPRDISESSSPYAYLSRIQLECRDGDEIMRAITGMVQMRIDLLKLFEPPQMKEEDAAKMLRSVVIANPKAPKLATDFSVAYPGKEGSRTDVQLTLLVPREQISPAEISGTEVYTIDVTGEVLRDGKLWEKYRYRFDFPGDFRGDKLPIVIDRYLRPAEYLSRIKVMDANSGAEAVVENALKVPEVFVPEPVQVAAAEEIAPHPDPLPAVSGERETKEPSLRIVPPSGDPVSGIQTIDTIISGEGIKGVEFSLDGKKVAVRRSEPFALDFDFGMVPQTRRIRVVGLDAQGKPLTGDELTVNTGTDPFRVRIVSPRIAPRLAGTARIAMDVRVPEGEELAALELFWNERRMATLYDAPFVQSIEIPPTEGVGYIRAVATLKNSSTPPVEDVVMINTPAFMEELNVHLVELPTTVLIGGKPADHLTEKSFKILDEGKPVPIAKFDYVKNLPLSIGMAFDVSGSMGTRLDEAQKAGAEFFEQVMRKGDKAFLVAFNKDVELVQKWSTRMADMHAGLARLRAEDMTALYDAVVYSLYNFQGIRGQKALILISDGKDTDSKFTFDQVMDYARRAAVPIYAIGISIKGTEVDVRYRLNKLAAETGGSVYYIEQARELHKVYDELQTELRSQYILGFYPPADIKPGSKWREVTVQSAEGKVKTVKGYFP